MSVLLERAGPCRPTPTCHYVVWRPNVDGDQIHHQGISPDGNSAHHQPAKSDVINEPRRQTQQRSTATTPGLSCSSALRSARSAARSPQRSPGRPSGHSPTLRP